VGFFKFKSFPCRLTFSQVLLAVQVVPQGPELGLLEVLQVVVLEPPSSGNL
jgi:hypothetical protein